MAHTSTCDIPHHHATNASIITLVGLAVREIALYQCGPSFNHTIQTKKRGDHKLITNGVYSTLRHPSYFGWFYWSTGSQVMLGNWLCVIGYVWAGWKFFSIRIPFEEKTLQKMFPEEYVTYAENTIIGIPFVKSGVVGGVEKKKE